MAFGHQRNFNMPKTVRDKHEEPWNEPNDSPLLNDLVLESLMNYIHGNDLKACRLVCRKWSLLSIPFARSRLRVTIWGTDSIDSEKSRGIENFIQLVESNTLGIPFGCFRLGSFDTMTGPGQKFLKLCGNIAKEFWLDRSVDHVVENVSALIKSAPKLESFVMPLNMTSRGGGVVQLFPGLDEREKPKLNFLKSSNVSDDNTQKRKKICPTFYHELFGAAEQVSTLSLTAYEFGRHGEENSEDALETLETLGKLTKIKNLKIVYVKDKHLEILERIAKQLNLKKLDLTLTTRIGNLNWFAVIKLFKNNLTCLNINSMACNSTSLTFPPMPNLKQLKLQIPDSRDLQPLWCETLNFTTTFPLLQKLHIFSFGLFQNLFNYFTTSEEPLITMKSLILQHDLTVGMMTLNRILTIFPKLTTLECQVNSNDGAEVIKKIWSHMIQLEGLNISGCLPASVSLDSLVTGIPVEELRSMAEVFESLGENTSTVDSHQKIIFGQVFASRPSIQNLAGLKSLNIRIKSEGDTNFMTDLTGYFGFYSLKNLYQLSVSHSEISKTCSEILVKDKELMSWRFMSVSDQEIIPPNWKYNNEY